MAEARARLKVTWAALLAEGLAGAGRAGSGGTAGSAVGDGAGGRRLKWRGASRADRRICGDAGRLAPGRIGSGLA